MRGAFGPGVLLGLLQGLHDARKSGTLHLAQRGRRRQIRLERGFVVDCGEPRAQGTDDDERASLAHAVLLQAFQDREGSYGFEETRAAPVEEGRTRRLAPGEMMLAMARRLDDEQAVEYALGDLDRLLVLVADPLRRLQKIQLTPSDAYLLSRVDGTLKAAEIVQIVSGPKLPALKSLFALLCAGLVRFAGKRRPTRRRGPRARGA